MSKESLAVTYRPKTFEDVTEQSCVCDILKEQLRNDTFQHAYLFCGPAGTGKTTLGRIFANEINKGVGSPIEVDAASNSGVDNIRVIIEESKHKSLDSEYKVFIIDECHSISNTGWQAFLKLLEEPPKYSIFILCTTDPQKIPATIISRVQRYQLSKISTNGIYKRLAYICQCENIDVNDSVKESLEFISKLAQGGMRDAITSMDKCISSGDLTLDNVVRALGNVEYDTQFNFLTALHNGNVEKSVEIVESVFNSGKSLKLFINQFQAFIVDICKYKVFNSFEYSQIPPLDEYKKLMDTYNKDKCVKLLDLICELNASLKWENDVRCVVESVLFTIGGTL